MAFGKAAGYTNLNSGNFSPVIYSKQVQLAFRKASIVDSITNNDYFGEIANMGDTVKIIKEPEISVSAYLRGTTITQQDLTDNDFSLVVDKANYFAFKVDDIEEAHSHINFQGLLHPTVLPSVWLTNMTKKFLATWLVSNSLLCMTMQTQ